METVTIFLTKEEADKFKTYQQYHDVFMVLLSKGVFDVQFGKCIMNFAFGKLQNVVKEEIVWKK